MKRAKKKGFTLVELIIVIAIIGVLAAVLIPTFAGVIDKANLAGDRAELKQMNTTLATKRVLDDVSYYEAAEVQRILLAEGYTLSARAKGYSFWYDRATNKVELLTADEAFGERIGSAGMVAYADGEETEYTANRIEALSPTHPSYLYIDTTQNALGNAIEVYRNLVTVAKDSLEGNPTQDQTVAKMTAIYEEQQAAALAAFPYTALQASLANFSPAKSIYVDEDGFYTAISPEASSITAKHMIFMDQLHTVPKCDLPVSNIQVGSLVEVPASVLSVQAGAFTKLSNTRIKAARANQFVAGSLADGIEIDFTDLDGSLYQTLVLSDYYTGSNAQIRHYFNTGNGKSNVTVTTATTLVAEESLESKLIRDNLDQANICAQYLVPRFDLKGGIDGNIIEENQFFFGDLNSIQSEEALARFNLTFAQNAITGNVVEIVGAASYGDHVYRMQRIGYFTRVAAWVDSTVGMLSADDILANVDQRVIVAVRNPVYGYEFANLAGMKVYADFTVSWNNNGAQSKSYHKELTAGAGEHEEDFVFDLAALTGETYDYTQDYSNEKGFSVSISKITVKVGDTVIFVQYGEE